MRQTHLAPTIDAVLQVLRARSLDVKSGTMSTVIAGDCEAVFDALKAVFEAAAGRGDLVMVASISNCCPALVVDAQNAS